MPLPDWLIIARDFGFPGVALVFLGFVIWKGGKWLGSVFLLPFQQRHFDFLTSLEKSLEQQATTAAQLGEAFRSHDVWERDRAQRIDSRIDRTERRIANSGLRADAFEERVNTTDQQVEVVAEQLQKDLTALKARIEKMEN